MNLFTPIANGAGTDHPLPGIAFVDDSHIPLHDPRAIEAIGRRRGTGTWGRYDRGRAEEGEWLAYTTDPDRPDLAWCVRYHPRHGRSVVLVQAADAAGQHMQWWNTSLLYRSGGYWWDGTTWFRPAQLWDRARQDYEHRPVPGASTVSAAQVLAHRGCADRGRILTVTQAGTEDRSASWEEDLALWAQLREENPDALPLGRCVVRVSAPELMADQMVDADGLAKIAGIAVPTLRGYRSRGEADVPAPQSVLGNRSAWARPVAEEWAEQRRRSPEALAAAVTGDGADALPAGQRDLRDHLARGFVQSLWQYPGRRRMWARRYRTADWVRDLADELATAVAADLGQVVPLDDLARTLRRAWLHDLARCQAGAGGPGPAGPEDLAVAPALARMLDWFIGHAPARAATTIAEIVGQGDRTLGITPAATAESICTALESEGTLPDAVRQAFLDRALPVQVGTRR